MKHTPGPWIKNTSSFKVYQQDRDRLRYGDAILIAQCGEDERFHPTEASANAHLITAAPEMYEICMDIASYWQKGQLPPEIIRQRLFALIERLK